MDVNREVGAHLVQNHPAKVQLVGADLDLHVEMVPDGAYLYADTFPGLGGLPVSVTGKVAVLLSGGIDSPVAAWRMQRRGCRVVLIHFHSHPLVSRASQDKAADLAARLARYQGRVRLHLVPFGEVQRDIVTTVPPPLRVVLYRRFMLRLAAALAERERARALVTGESLAQVASQTLANMVVIDEAAPMTVLRPLVGFDKNEIIQEAKRLGTYDISIVPDQDCCQLFVPKHPETHATLDQGQGAEATLAVDPMCASALARVETRDFAAPWTVRASEPAVRAEVGI
ncbi:MAG: tRNA 4-thiouridine(8) synthase ThiI [Deltaproteobacteria bacterium]|nr:tRNA 4-thiouridine(8) synthase ThiI [Deltaproteobacteria bacterium]